MVTLKNKIAIGCLVQWYEIKIVEEYIQSVRNALELVDNVEHIILDFVLVINQDLEKINNQMTMEEVETKFMSLLPVTARINYKITDELYTIADYRRNFNDKYCEEVDVLMWGETDSLIPSQTFEILDNLHTQVKDTTPKYVGFFSTCKMWDDSWKVLEHPDFTDKPFIEGDTENWWSLRYTMNQEEMDSINQKTEELDVRVVNPYKFNGCGLVISSDVVKAGVNIPRSVFFIHEDTAFMHVMQRTLGDLVPQYLIKNILLVHNRKHPKKRFAVLGEEDIEKTDTGALRKAHDWYEDANKMCEHNAYNLFNQTKVYSWKDVFK